MRHSSALEHRTLSGADSSHAGALLRPHFPAGAVNLATPLGARGSLSCFIAFEDDGAVEDVAAEGEVEFIGWVVGEGPGFH